MKNTKVLTAILYLIIILCAIVFGISFLFENFQKWILLSVFFVAGISIGLLSNIRNNIRLHEKINWLNERVKLTNTIAYRVKVAGEKCFTDMPLGIIVFNNNYAIEWANDYAKIIFQSPLVERKFTNLNKELDAKIRALNDFEIEVYGKDYSMSVLRDSNVLYITDRTEISRLSKRYFNRTQVAGILNLDNFDEALSSIDAQKRALKISDIIGLLSDWCDKYNIYIRGYSEKQYLILMDREQLEQVILEKFNIIDIVNDYSNNEGLKITVSLGVACFDEGITELMTKANELLELALNRGGNQAAVSIDNNLKYFGGKDKGIDTRLPVYVRVQTEDLQSLILSSSNVVVMSHGNTDADAFGSSIGLYKIVKALGKDCSIVLDENQCDITVIEVYREIQQEHIGMVDMFVTPNKALNLVSDDTLLILTDCQYAQLLIDEKVLKRAKKIAIIDHHRSNNLMISNHIYMYNKTTSSSSVELIVEMFDYFSTEIKLTNIEATIMLLGIIVDTNNLIYRTSSQTFMVISKLQSFGAEMSKVQKFLRDDYELYIKRMKFLNNMELIDGTFGIAVCDKESIYTRQFIAKIADNIIFADNVRAGFCIGKIAENVIAISARSFEEFNVQLIMEEFGGGGHFNNSAAQIKNMTIEEAKEKLIKVLKNQEDIGEEKMKIILVKDVKGKGKAGDVIDIPSGHANYLVRQKMAILGTADNLTEMTRRNEQDKIEAEKHYEEMKQLKATIESNPITIEVRVGKEGKLFGSVSTKQIVDEIKDKLNITLDKRKILSDKEIDGLGTYKIPIQLHKEVVANITLYVVEKKG